MKLKKRLIYGFICITLFTNPFNSYSQSNETLKKEVDKLDQRLQYYRHEFNSLEKSIDDIMWFKRVGDIAIIDKVHITGPPLTKQQTPNSTAQGAGNPFKFSAYIFIPQDYEPGQKYPLLVFPHGGVHGDFNTFYTHVVRELMAQDYIVIAPEYRGSTGYGGSTYRAIDYGGKEMGDDYAARNYMINNYSMVDENRIGKMGWSHGGLHTLMGIFRHPKAYKVAYAGMPVSDLVARMGYKTQGYRDLYSADYHIGKTAYQDVKEYMRRSPAWNAEKLETPLLIHTNTNDADVNALEVRHLIQALKAAGKDDLFQYKIYEDKPGGHTFNRLDLKESKESRLDIYKFLAKYLHPEHPMKSMDQMMKASYKLK